MPSMRLLGGIALLAVSATGCGMAAAAPEQDVTVPAEPTRIDFVDPATVTGLAPRTLTEGEAAGRHVHISYPELPGATRLNALLREDAQRQLRDFRDTTTPVGHLPRPELNVDWQLAAAGDVVGVRLRTGEYRGADWGNATRTFWYDRRTGQASGSAGLLSGHEALREVSRLVRNGLKHRGPEVDRQQVSAERGQLDSMAFNGEGDLVVEFDDCQIGPCSLGRLAVAVPAGKVTPLLSETGLRAQESVRESAQRVARAGWAPGRAVPAAASTRAGTVDCTTTKCVALTFDDGPGPYTAELLDVLREADARATFFPVGSGVAAQPELLRRMRDEGHLVGNHTWDHRDLSRLPTSKISDQLGRAGDAVAAAIGQRPTLVRAPYGEVSLDVRNVARERELSLVGWDVDSRDRRGGDAGEIARWTAGQAHPGAIMLMHDLDRTTVDAVPGILKELQGKGYAFVTVPELYGTAGMQAGHVYTSGIGPSRKQPLT
ncbi:polysaccharide deacetylase family protein [Nonomuraea sp. SBT364]|uniref:polysaccharide deacetylase family protein n=1 Tax=Nonomuraea sp. SBT364 TaxID=1580530 RepID=UPI000B195EDB|nr:polysaccharide deacetylase family protein [Nonomuraea sp. SBT364]